MVEVYQGNAGHPYIVAENFCTCPAHLLRGYCKHAGPGRGEPPSYVFADPPAECGANCAVVYGSRWWPSYVSGEPGYAVPVEAVEAAWPRLLRYERIVLVKVFVDVRAASAALSLAGLAGLRGGEAVFVPRTVPRYLAKRLVSVETRGILVEP